jgi:hypothetical protein
MSVEQEELEQDSVQELEPETVESQYDFGDPADSPADEPAAEDGETGEGDGEANPPPALDETLVEYARQFGLDDDDLADLDDAQLTRMLRMIDKSTMQHFRRMQNSGGQPKPTEEAKPAQQAAEAKKRKVDLQLDPEKWDEETISVLNSINDHYGSQIEEFEKELAKRDEQLAALNGWVTSEQSQRIESEIDGWFVAQGDKYADLFGAGSISQIGTNRTALKARQEVVAEAEAIRQADAAMGRKPDSWKRLLDRATASRYSDKTQELARREITQKAEKRKSQAINRPSSRSSQVKSPKENAVNFVRSKYKALGIGIDDFDDDL